MNFNRHRFRSVMVEVGRTTNFPTKGQGLRISYREFFAELTSIKEFIKTWETLGSFYEASPSASKKYLIEKGTSITVREFRDSEELLFFQHIEMNLTCARV